MGNLRFTEFLSPLGREVKKLPPSNHTHLENKRTRSPYNSRPDSLESFRLRGSCRCSMPNRRLLRLRYTSAESSRTPHTPWDVVHGAPKHAPSHLIFSENQMRGLGISKAWLTTFAMTHRRISYRGVRAAWRQNRGTSAEASYLIALLGAPKTHRRLLCAWRHNDANKNTNANATNQKRKHDGGIVKPLCRPCVNMQTANSHIVSS